MASAFLKLNVAVSPQTVPLTLMTMIRQTVTNVVHALPMFSLVQRMRLIMFILVVVRATTMGGHTLMVIRTSTALKHALVAEECIIA
jgi:hypothetical protein